MIRTYQFCAQPHHEFHAGGAVYHGGDTFELDEDLATDERLVEVPDGAQETEPPQGETVETVGPSPDLPPDHPDQTGDETGEEAEEQTDYDGPNA